MASHLILLQLLVCSGLMPKLVQAVNLKIIVCFSWAKELPQTCSLLTVFTSGPTLDLFNMKHSVVYSRSVCPTSPKTSNHSSIKHPFSALSLLFVKV